MAIYNRYSKGAVPQDPRKKRPLSPLEDYPYEQEVAEPPAPMPDLPIPQSGPLPVPPLSPGLNRPGGPEEFPYTPPRNLTQFRQWYAGQPVTPVGLDEIAPPAPEWGKKTPTYSRMNPPPPKPVVSPSGLQAAPAKPMSPIVRQTPPTVAGGPVQAQTPPTTGGIQPFGRKNYLDTSWLDTVKEEGVGAGPLQPGTRAKVDTRNLTPGIQPLQRPGQKLRPGTTAQLDVSPPPSASGRGLAPDEQRLRTEAMLSGMRTDQKVRNQLNKELNQRQVAAERARIPGSVGGWIAGKMFDTPQGQQTAGQFINRGFRTAGELLASVLRGFAAQTGSPLAMEAVQRDVKPVQDWLAQRFPIDADKKDFLNATVPEVLGSVGAFIAGSAATGGTMLGGAAMGALTNAASTYDEALAAGASHENAVKAARLGALPGSMEGVLGIGRNLRKAPKARPLLERTFNMGEEAFQETFTQALNNVNAKIVSGYDPQRAWDEGFEESFLGGLVGGAAVEAGGALIRGAGQAARTILSRPDGGAQKVPDAFTGEPSDTAIRYQNWANVGGTRAPQAWNAPEYGAGTAPSGAEQSTPRTGETTRIPKSDLNQRYQDWTMAGGVRAPESWTVGRRQPPAGELEGRVALPPATPQLGGRLALPPAPTRPSVPGGMPTPPAPTGERPVAQPTPTPQPTPQPEEESGELFRPAGPGYLSPKWSRGRAARGILYGITGPKEEAELDAQLELEKAKYIERMADFESGLSRRRPRMPTGRSLSGAYGNIAQAGNKAPNFGMLKLKEPYGIPQEANVENVYEPVMGRIASEMGQILGRDLSIGEIESAASAQPRTNETAGIWDKWYSRYGADYGLDTDDLMSLEDMAFSKGRGSLFNNPDLQAALVGDTNQPEINKDVMDVIREDIARLLGLPEENYQKISLSRLSPNMWRLWARSNGFDNERKFPGFMESLERMIRRGSDLKTRDKNLSPGKADRKTPIPRKGAPTPATGGRTVSFEGRDIALSDEQAQAWDKADKDYSWFEETLQRAIETGNAYEIDRARKGLYGAGMKRAAERRKITGTLTPKEEAKQPKFAKGTRVWVDGNEGTIQGASYGDWRVRLKDGRTISAKESQISQTPPAPAPAPSKAAKLREYQSGVSAGVPRAPQSFVPGMPSRRQGPGYQMLPGGRTATTGRPQGPQPPMGLQRVLPAPRPLTPPAPPTGGAPIGTTEREEAKTRREQLKRKSPFAAAKEREQAKVTPPTAPRPSVPAPAPPRPVTKVGGKPVNLQTLKEAGWEQETSQRFTHPDGRVIERDSGSTGRKAGWYSTDPSGNYEYHEDLRGAILAAVEQAPTAVAPEAKPATPPPAASKPATDVATATAALKAAEAKLKEIVASEPRRLGGGSEKRYFGRQGRAGATPQRQAKFDASMREHAEWKARKDEAGREAERARKSGFEAGLASLKAIREAEAQAKANAKPWRAGATFEPGERVRTATGDATTPYPATKDRAAIDKWLRDNALLESKRRPEDDETNMFGRSISGYFLEYLPQKSLTDADRTALERYIFDKDRSEIRTLDEWRTQTGRSTPTPTTETAEASRAKKAKAEPVKAEPAPTPTPKVETGAAETATETATESDKAIFEDIDQNKNKKGAKTRIKNAYGARGTKALFIEDNINQILQEAEENGKVTKICPD